VPSYNQIHQLVHDTFSENRLRLLGYAINNKMEILDEYHAAIIALDKEELARFDYQVGDTEGVVNYPLSMKKIKMSVLVTERQGVVRFSFRSKGDFSVHEVAQKHFNGGGHTNAAGGTLNCSMEAALAKLHGVLPEYKELLNKD
jgi:phosphoesterase RecJ-like protein